MRRPIVLGVALLATLGGGRAGAQLGDPDLFAQSGRFSLFNGCVPMAVAVGTVERPRLGVPVQDAAESRLRAARVYTDDLTWTQEALLFTIRSIREDGISPYHVSLKFMKPLRDPVTGFLFRATTWSSTRFGVDDDPVILSAVSQLLDQFLAAYLRVNADACE